eukprot:4714565-Prymnesium_polylepis.1
MVAAKERLVGLVEGPVEASATANTISSQLEALRDAKAAAVSVAAYEASEAQHAEAVMATLEAVLAAKAEMLR